MCPVGVPFDSVRHLGYLMRTTRIHSQRIGGVSGVLVINQHGIFFIAFFYKLCRCDLK